MPATSTCWSLSVNIPRLVPDHESAWSTAGDIKRRKYSQSTVVLLHAMNAYVGVEPIRETMQNRPTCDLSSRALTHCSNNGRWPVCPRETIHCSIPFVLGILTKICNPNSSSDKHNRHFTQNPRTYMTISHCSKVSTRTTSGPKKQLKI